jgi:uncharacterized repeat protein (TIGR03803 family)
MVKSKGVVFKMTPSGQVTILHSFGDGTVADDGAYPRDGLIAGANGNFHGTTLEGGSAGHGIVFEITSSGQMTVVHSFGDGSVTDDGEQPRDSLLLDSTGNFYGTTFYGGSAGDGTIFQMTSAGQVTILHSFGDGSVAKDGVNPNRNLIMDAVGNFYGVTNSGGSGGKGTVFSMTPSRAVTILHAFGDGTVAP